MSTPVPQPGLFPADEYRTEVLLIRHGRSASVVPGTPESHDPPLAPEGHEQAAALAARLDGKPLDAIYASNLRRAVETAGYLAAPRGMEVVQRADLREVHLGEWEGGEFRRRASVRDPEWLAFAASGSWDTIPGAEGDLALRTRAVTAFDEIVAAHPGESVAVVSHGGLINACLASLLGVDRATFSVIENTSVSLVRTGGGRIVVITINDCHHLYDPLVAVGVAAG